MASCRIALATVIAPLVFNSPAPSVTTRLCRIADIRAAGVSSTLSRFALRAQADRDVRDPLDDVQRPDPGSLARA